LQPELSKEPIELVIFSVSGDSVDSFNERFGGALAKHFPNYTFTYIKSEKGKTLQELLAAGQQIDIYWDSIRNYITSLQYEIQMDMEPLLKKHGVDVSQFEPTAIDGMRKLSGGKLWGIPVFNNNLALFYNKDIFNKFGVPYPNDGMTWDEVLELNKKLTREQDGKQYLGLAVTTTQMLSTNQYSLPFIDEKTGKSTLSDERWKKFYTTLYEEPAKVAGYREYIRANNNNIPSTGQFHKEQNLAMFAYLSSYFQVNAVNLKEVDWDMVSIPTFKELPGVGVQSYPTYFSVTNMSKHKDEAMAAIKALVSEEVQTELSRKGIMPGLNSDKIKKVFGEQSEFKDKNWKAVYYNKFAEFSTKTKYEIALQNFHTDPMKKIASGEMDVNTALLKAEEAVNKFLDDENKR